MSIQFYDNKILFVDDKIAMDPACCCGGYCLIFWGIFWQCPDPNEPGLIGCNPNGGWYVVRSSLNWPPPGTPYCISGKSDPNWGKVGYPPYLRSVRRLPTEWCTVGSRVKKVTLYYGSVVTEVLYDDEPCPSFEIWTSYSDGCSCGVGGGSDQLDYVKIGTVIKGDPPTYIRAYDWLDWGAFGMCYSGFRFTELRNPLEYGEIPNITRSCANFWAAEHQDWKDNWGGAIPYVTRPVLPDLPVPDANHSVSDSYGKKTYCTPVLKVVFDFPGASLNPNPWYYGWWTSVPGHLWQDGECQIIAPDYWWDNEVASGCAKGGAWLTGIGRGVWTISAWSYLSSFSDTFSSWCVYSIEKRNDFLNDRDHFQYSFRAKWEYATYRDCEDSTWTDWRDQVSMYRASDADFEKNKNKNCDIDIWGQVETTDPSLVTGGKLTISWAVVGFERELPPNEYED